MGINIRLQDERGRKLDEILDPSNLLCALLPWDDPSFACLRFVDPYGDTTFNAAQSEVLVAELARIRAKASQHAELELLDGIQRLVQLCLAAPHRYVKFIGD